MMKYSLGKIGFTTLFVTLAVGIVGGVYWLIVGSATEEYFLYGLITTLANIVFFVFIGSLLYHFVLAQFLKKNAKYTSLMHQAILGLTLSVVIFTVVVLVDLAYNDFGGNRLSAEKQTGGALIVESLVVLPVVAGMGVLLAICYHFAPPRMKSKDITV